MFYKSEQEINEALRRVSHLTKYMNPPETEWQFAVLYLVKIQIFVEYFKEKKLLSKNEENLINQNLSEIKSWTVLNSPDVVYDETKKRARTSPY